MSGGINAAITGGNVGMGALTGGISAGIAKGLGSYLPANPTGNEFADFAIGIGSHAAIGGITGGISAELYGGTFRQGFEQGAMTGAIGYAANGWLHDKVLPWLKKTLGTAYVDINGMLIIGGGGYLIRTDGVYPYYCFGPGFGLSATAGGSQFEPGERFYALTVSTPAPGLNPVIQTGWGNSSGFFSEAGVSTGWKYSAAVCYISKITLFE